jgi:hypothetical protein
LRVCAIERVNHAGESVLAATVSRIDGTEARLWFAYPEEHTELVSDRADAFLVAALQPAMASGSALTVEGVVSPRLLSEIESLQDIFHRWFGWSRVPVQAPVTAASEHDPSGREAAFFALGVDSWHTLLTNSASITHLVHMRGIEWPLSRSDDREAGVIDQAAAVARDRGKVLVAGRTNLRDVFPLDWATEYSGAGLAAVALSMTFDRFRIPSTHPWEYLFPFGSSPITDPRWSTETTRIIHDGADRSRTEKLLATVIGHEDARRTLRVCSYNLGGPGNCGRCEKCVRTMLPLHLTGRLLEVPAFPSSLPRLPSRRVSIGDTGRKAASDRAYLHELVLLLDELKSSGSVARMIRRRWLIALAAEYSERRGGRGFARSLLGWVLHQPRVWLARAKRPLRPLWNRLGRFQAPIRRAVGREFVGG